MEELRIARIMTVHQNRLSVKNRLTSFLPGRETVEV
jgi:hypothetical protein